jgi:tetratricopeptide (TPR) repeat protein
MFGPMLYNWGYSNYNNPYYGSAGAATVASQPMVYDYGQPINAESAPPEETVADQALASFDSAREAFKAGDYAKALELTDQALKSTPNDPALHEFRALALFALKRYDEAAAALYAVLSVGPGWDWTTLISLYADPETYTQQLRALEDVCSQNPKSAAPQFVLAYNYLTQGHSDAALRKFKDVVALQPKDQLSAQLAQQLEQPKQAPGTEAAQAQPAPGAPPAAAAANEPPAGKQGTLQGTWTAQPNADTAITLTVDDAGRFTWKVARQGKDQQFGGKFTFENGILTLVQDQTSNTMVGKVTWQDEKHLNFKVMGAGPGDPGLTFAKSS